MTILGGLKRWEIISGKRNRVKNERRKKENSKETVKGMKTKKKKKKEEGKKIFLTVSKRSEFLLEIKDKEKYER